MFCKECGAELEDGSKFCKTSHKGAAISGGVIELTIYVDGM